MTRRHGASARRTWVVMGVVLVIAIAVPSLSPFDPFSVFRPQVVRSQGNIQPSCYAFVNFHNRRRRVYGDVNAECPGGQLHTPPFGNWGVDSNWGVRYDGFQFPGWKWMGG